MMNPAACSTGAAHFSPLVTASSRPNRSPAGKGRTAPDLFPAGHRFEPAEPITRGEKPPRPVLFPAGDRFEPAEPITSGENMTGAGHRRGKHG